MRAVAADQRRWTHHTVAWPSCRPPPPILSLSHAPDTMTAHAPMLSFPTSHSFTKKKKLMSRMIYVGERAWLWSTHAGTPAVWGWMGT